MDDMPMDALPSGYVLVIKSHDVPGVIGQVASLLGRAKLNIGEYGLGRNEPGGVAFPFINLDTEAPEEVLADLQRFGTDDRSETGLFISGLPRAKRINGFFNGLQNGYTE